MKARGTKRLKLDYDEPLSNFAFRFNSRRYNVALQVQARLLRHAGECLAATGLRIVDIGVVNTLHAATDAELRALEPVPLGPVSRASQGSDPVAQGGSRGSEASREVGGGHNVDESGGSEGGHGRSEGSEGGHGEGEGSRGHGGSEGTEARRGVGSGNNPLGEASDFKARGVPVHWEGWPAGPLNPPRSQLNLTVQSFPSQLSCEHLRGIILAGLRTKRRKCQL